MPNDHSANQTYSPVVLIHGTYAGPKDGYTQWYQPTSDFCAALDNALKKRDVDARCWAGAGDAAQYFHWGPGENDWLARAEAAECLRKYLKGLQKPCHLVAHSHGGNVVLDALGWNGGDPADWFSGSVTLLGTPILEPEKRQSYYSAVLGGALLLALAVRFLGYSQFHLWQVLLLAGLPVVIHLVRKLDDGPDIFRIATEVPFVQVVNSEHDEAYRLLSSIPKSPNPFLELMSPKIIHRFGSAIRRFWAESASSDDNLVISGSGLSVIGLLVLAIILFATGILMPAVIAYWAMVLLLMALTGLNFISSTRPTERYLRQLVNRIFVFGQKLVAYPFVLLATSVAKRMSWPLLQARALGLVGSPFRVDRVEVVSSPSRMKSMFEYWELPDDLLEQVFQDRNQGAQQQLDRLLENLTTTNWSLDTIRKCLVEFQEPGLVHSSYYRYLEHGWVINVIADHIAYDEAVREGDVEKVKSYSTYNLDGSPRRPGEYSV